MQFSVIEVKHENAPFLRGKASTTVWGTLLCIYTNVCTCVCTHTPYWIFLMHGICSVYWLIYLPFLLFLCLEVLRTCTVHH